MQSMTGNEDGSKKDEGGAEKTSVEEPEITRDEKLDGIRAFNRKPKEIRDYLDRFVIKQEQAKRVLSVAVCDHYNHIRTCIKDSQKANAPYVKPNVLLLGPTGVGKTFLMRNVAQLIGVPFVKADATKFSETGYVGYDVDDLVRDLVKAADGDVELAQYGIVYVDEIDKIASESSKSGRDVSGRGVANQSAQIDGRDGCKPTFSSGYDGTNESFHGYAKGWKAEKTKHFYKEYTFHCQWCL